MQVPKGVMEQNSIPNRYYLHVILEIQILFFETQLFLRETRLVKLSIASWPSQLAGVM